MNTNRTMVDNSEIIQTSTSGVNNLPNNNNAESSSSANANANATPRMKRMTLNEAQKYEICTYMKEEEERSGRPTNKAVSVYIFNKYNIKVDESTVSRLKQQAEKRLSGDLANPTAKRHRPVAFPELERLLGEFVQANKRKVAITDSMLLNKGKELREYLNIPEAQMKFSDGWLNKFKVRHGLKQAPIPKPVQPNLNQSGKRQGNGSTSVGSQPGVAAVENGFDDVAVQSTRPSASSSGTDHNDSQQDVDMDVDGMDIDITDTDPQASMEQVLRSHSTRSNKSGNTTAVPLSDASGAISQQSTSRLALRSSRNKASSAAAASTSTSQLDNTIPLSTSSTMDTDALADLELPGATTTSARLANGISTDTANVTTRPTPPATAARASLSMHLVDPIDAAFHPEPAVDFEEASQCVNTLRIFMQQQNFGNEQLKHLRDIYTTLKSKRKQN